MAFLYNKLTRRIVLALIILWGVGSFWVLSTDLAVRIVIILLGLLSIVFTLFEIVPIILLIFLSFLVSYVLYGFLFQFSLPIWLVMLSILLIFGYIFLYTEQKIGILGNKRLVYLVLFSLITLEVFLTLNYYLISPLSKSLIIATISYLYIGFCYTVLAKHTDNKLITYIFIATFVIAMIFLSSIWGGVI